MWNRFSKLLSNSNNDKTTTSKADNTNQLANPLSVALLITGEIPTFILDLPAMWWMTVTKDSTIEENNFEKMSDSTRIALQKLYDYVKPAKEHKKGLVFDENFATYELIQVAPDMLGSKSNG